jgi:hypothetical protein
MSAAGVEPLLLAGYRIMPPWRVRVPGLPAKVLTLSSCLVDAVPDDDTWFDSGRQAAKHLRPGVNLLAVGIPESHADFPLGPPVRDPWPAGLLVLGYELISPDEPGFHSWHCYCAAHDRLNSYGLVNDLAAARQLAEQSNSRLRPTCWLPVAVALITPVMPVTS